MGINNNVQHLAIELHSVLDRFRREYDVNYAEVIGTLQMVLMDIYNEAAEVD